MAELTKERLMALSNRENVGAICGDEIVAMARQLIASMEQEPVAEISQAQEYDLEGNLRHQRDIDYYQDDIDKLPVGAKLYAAPQLPQPALPDENGLLPCPFCGSAARVVDNRLGFYVQCCSDNCDGLAIGPRVPELQSEQEEKSIDWEALAQAAKDKWNRRAAMLQGAEPVQGWVPCSERMPPRIQDTSIEYLVYNRVSHDYWSVPEGNRSCQAFWNHYSDSVTHWMPLPASPEHGVKG